MPTGWPRTSRRCGAAPSASCSCPAGSRIGWSANSSIQSMLPGRLRAFRFQAPGLGAAQDFKWQAVAVPARTAATPGQPGQSLGTLDERGGRCARPADRAEDDCRRGRQGLPKCSAVARWSQMSASSSFGTTATINTTQTRYLEVQRMLPRRIRRRCPAPTTPRSRSTAASGWCPGSSASSRIASRHSPPSAASPWKSCSTNCCAKCRPGSMGLTPAALLVPGRA